MNYIKHLTGFFIRIAAEETIYPTHISLYLALFQSWNINRFKNPIAISRDEMMKASRIASKATYHKCIKELQSLGFIDYIPSYNPYSGSEVILHDLSDRKSVFKTQTSSIIDQTQPINNQANSKGTEQVNEPNIYNKKKTSKNNKNIFIDTNSKILNEEKFLETKEKEMPLAFANTNEKKIDDNWQKKSSAKKKEIENPSFEQVKDYFKQEEFSEFEAERFYNYYTSNGWLIGGKTKMIDWHAAARNWILNTAKFTINLPQNPKVKEQPRAKQLQVVEDKNYAEPL
ncbi:transcriptional regulator [Flavobacterium sp. NRK F10]|uniref:transcriptional regulator n=1 Tax=Flavobacterium sp. NRK F10 TaxID=2954931 RepID=UPI0020910692|nr:transcriptional regulator [Flavobacterium sp. NRK F10]MCO6175878.1 transcriptional regulator [Flavobacterium sp. NRK F10]